MIQMSQSLNVTEPNREIFVIVRMKWLSFLFFSISLSGCFVSKDQRVLYKTDQRRETDILLSAYLDTPLSGLFLTFQKDGTYGYLTSGMFKSYEHGTWQRNGDFFMLECTSSTDKIPFIRSVAIDTVSKRLILHYNDSVERTMKIFQWNN